MTITAVADAAGTPPSVDVTVEVTAGGVMSSVALWRNDSSGRSLVRTQPSAGFDSRTVTDYECPYDEAVTYDWTTTYSGTFTTVFTETWANVAAWTTQFGSVFAVSAGTVHNTATNSAIYHTLTTGPHRVIVDGWTVSSGTGYLSLMISGFSGTVAELSLSGGVLSITGDGSPTVTTIDASQPFTIDMGDDSVTVTGTGGETTVAAAATAIFDRIVLLSNNVPASGYVMDNITAQTYDSPTDLAETSDPITLDPADAWLIHPASPALSIPLQLTSPDTTRLVQIGGIENRSNTTTHRILGSATPLTTTTGPRADDVTTMTVETATTDESAALRALLAPDIPILIQIPPDMELDFNCGFYQVGDVTTDRSHPVINSYRTFTLPITKVRSPVVDVEDTGWSYAAVAAEFATYASLLVTYATYADLAADSRS